MTPNIWLFSLEILDSRYSKQWYTAIPDSLRELATNQNLKVNIITVDGVQNTVSPQPGAFLDFTDTNYYKSTQLCKFIEYFREGKTTVNDIFLFSDFWNPCISQIAYMRDLMDQNWKLHSIVHAGAYDPTDILGMKMSKPWPHHQERAWYYACDRNWYATDFHRQMFLRNLGIPQEDHGRAFVSGQPHSEIIKSMAAMTPRTKRNLVIWPHRYNSDKQPQIAVNLSAYMNDPWCITQTMNLSKTDYYSKLLESQVLFSCSLHENLGISIMEGVLAGVIPVLPARCSYTEMYLPEFLYPSKWTQDWDHYLQYREELAQFIQHRVDHPEYYADALQAQRKILEDRYLSADKMYQSMLADIVSAQKTK